MRVYTKNYTKPDAASRVDSRKKKKCRKREILYNMSIKCIVMYNTDDAAATYDRSETRTSRRSTPSLYYDSSALTAAVAAVAVTTAAAVPSNGEYLAAAAAEAAAAADDPAAEGECRFWYLAAGRPSAASGDGSDSADDEPVPGGDCAGL